MANPYSDHTGSYIGANYNRAQDPNSQYGTRRLNWFVVEVAGYDISGEAGWSVEQGVAGEGPDDGYRTVFGDGNAEENLESPKSILYPVLRALAIKGEVFFNGEADTQWDGEYPYSYITVAMAQDTQIDGESNWLSNWSWSIEDTVGDAIPSDFNWDYVNVYTANIIGSEIQLGNSNALAKGAKGMTAADARAARIAAGKMGKISATKSLELAKAAKK